MPGSRRKCKKCGKVASYRFVRFEHGKPEEFYYCEEHATESSPHIQKPPQHEAIHALLQGLYQAGKGPKKAKPQVPDIKCKACGLSFEQYKRTLLLGCAECYLAFEKHLTPELRRFHGEIRHIGRTPSGAGSTQPPMASQGASASSPGVAASQSVSEGHPTPPKPTPSAPVKPSEPSIAELRGQLKKAVESEEFEDAAKLRDRIRKAERKKQD